MGKKKGTTSSGATAGASKASLDWYASTISKREENKMRSLGLIPSAESDFRHPGSASRPKPPKGFTVMFLWQLTPNSILHLSIFITVWEAFLGIEPHWGLWRKIFYIKRHNGNEGPHMVDGVSFVVRKEINYFNFPMRESVQGWRQKWFYLWDIQASGRHSNLPPFEDVLAAVPKKSWQNTLTTEESKVADQLYEKILDLKNAEGQMMCGTEVVTLFLKRWVQPVMSRVHQLWLYTGANDKSRVSPTDFSEEDLRDEPIYATVDDVVDFADQFTRLESENVQLCKAVKTLAGQVLEAYMPTAEAQSKKTCLKDELKKLKKKMKDGQEARHKAFIEVDEKEGALHESIGNLLSTTDMPVDRMNKFRVDSMSDALTFASESSKQIQDLLTKTKGALSRFLSMMFPKLDQNKTLGEMADTFFIDSSDAIAVLKRRSCLYGAVLTFQLLMGHGLGSEMEKLSEALPVNANNCLVDLEPFKQSSLLCANRLLRLVEEYKKKDASGTAPSSSAQTSTQI
ncbi:hypothetical protein QYE76_011457 [Lolium multiflorum]|uniref:Transposase (putative) gypsy type domain-containing protein n=1 Tax=Lolium multiflorum TaxID=4521 RepID=A0AAD8X411_LOLMU|nr:hypothetical protein QYE76_011457 [Lolium multiflorum]